MQKNDRKSLEKEAQTWGTILDDFFMEESRKPMF